MADTERVAYTDADAFRMMQKQKLKDGAVVKVAIAWAGAKTKPTVKGKGPGDDQIINTKLNVLNPDDEATRIKGDVGQLWMSTYTPLRDPNNPETHVPPDFATNFWESFCYSFLSDEFSPPERGVSPDNEFVHKKALLEKAAEIMTNESSRQELLRLTAYATIRCTPNGNGGFWTNLNNLRAELRSNESLTPMDELVETFIPGQDGEVVNEDASSEEAPRRRRR